MQWEKLSQELRISDNDCVSGVFSQIKAISCHIEKAEQSSEWKAEAGAISSSSLLGGDAAVQ